jgi:hypothetical protein
VFRENRGVVALDASIPKEGLGWQNDRELSVTASARNAANAAQRVIASPSHADHGGTEPIQNTPSDLH